MPTRSQRSSDELPADLWVLRPEAIDSFENNTVGERLEDDPWQVFERQAVDEAWAAQAESSATDELVVLAETAGFDLEGVECRDSMCVARLRFEDSAKAYERFPHVAGHAFALPCTVSVTSDNPDAPREHDLLRVYFMGCHKG